MNVFILYLKSLKFHLFVKYVKFHLINLNLSKFHIFNRYIKLYILHKIIYFHFIINILHLEVKNLIFLIDNLHLNFLKNLIDPCASSNFFFGLALLKEFHFLFIFKCFNLNYKKIMLESM